jgi:hypothetical protein
MFKKKSRKSRKNGGWKTDFFNCLLKISGRILQFLICLLQTKAKLYVNVKINWHTIFFIL